MTDEEALPAREQSLVLSDSPQWPSCLDAAELRYRVKWARSKKRFWYNKRADCIARPGEDFQRKRLPWFGGDEYGRKTLVIPIPFHGDFNWAFWTWTGAEDHEMREQTWKSEIREMTRPKSFQETYTMSADIPLNVQHKLDDIDLRWTMYYEDAPEDTIPCAAYPLDWNTLRLYPIESVDTAVTVRVEIAKLGSGIKCMTEDR